MRDLFFPLKQIVDHTLDPFMFVLLALSAAVAAYGLFIQDMYLCLETTFIVFFPFLLWSSYRRRGFVDFFAPDVGFPLVYIAFLFVGSIRIPIETQFGLDLPWVLWFYYIAGLVAYLVGVHTFRWPNLRIADREYLKRYRLNYRFLFVTLIVLAIGATARAAEILKWGLEIFHANDEHARIVGATGILGVLTISMEAGFECLLLFFIVRRPKGILRLFIAGCLAIMLLNAVATTDRTGLLRILIAAVVIVHYTRWRFKTTAVLGIAIFTVVFVSVLGTFRDVSNWGEARINSLENQGFTSRTYWLMSGYDVVRLPTETFYMTIQDAPVITPYTYGATSLASLTEVLPGHRPGPSEIVKNNLHLEFVGFGAAATILAPLWFDGGLMGILIGMFLFGLISRLLYQRMLLSDSCVWLLLYAWFVQNAFKAIKDDILPDLGVPFVMFVLVMVCVLADRPSEDSISVRPDRAFQSEGAA